MRRNCGTLSCAIESGCCVHTTSIPSTLTRLFASLCVHERVRCASHALRLKQGQTQQAQVRSGSRVPARCTSWLPADATSAPRDSGKGRWQLSLNHNLLGAAYRRMAGGCGSAFGRRGSYCGPRAWPALALPAESTRRAPSEIDGRAARAACGPSAPTAKRRSTWPEMERRNRHVTHFKEHQT